MEDKNIHIKEYLDYYTGLSIPPEYAILLRGNWGGGKTWFIKNYIQPRQSDFLYVSLYGLTSYKEIEEAFFQQLHPFFAKKGMKLAGALLKGLLKATIKIDLDGAKNDVASANMSIPAINPQDYLNNIDKKILVFDDLERCSIDIHNVFGYINQLVEANGLKVIIVANEAEIISSIKDDQKSYLRVKEKLIGKSFDIQFNFEEPAHYFIDQLKDAVVREILKEELASIKELFTSAEYNNLRHLRQIILDFYRFYTLLPDKFKQNREILNHTIKLFFVLSFEIKGGKLKEEELTELFNIEMFFGKKREESIYQKIRNKYFILSNPYHPILPTIFQEYFRTGFYSTQEVENSTKDNNYFIEENTPNWKKLWNFIDLSEKEFKRLFNSVFQKLKDSNINDKYEFIQIVGLLMYISDVKLVDLQKQEIIVAARHSIKKLIESDKLTISTNEEFPTDSSHGLRNQGLGIPEYKEFIKNLEKQIELSKERIYSSIADQLLVTLEESVHAFIEKISITNSTENLYYDIPILKYIPVEKFVDTFLKLSNEQKKVLGWRFDNRYKHSTHEALKDELLWLKEVRNSINNRKVDDIITNYIIQKYFLKKLDTCIAMLE